MNVLVDIAHPAHVHFYRHMISALEAKGHRTLVLARDKDVTLALLDAYEIPYRTTGVSRARSRFGDLAELVSRTYTLFRMGREFAANVIITRNPAGVQAARLLGIPGVFDTDDGSAAGIHFRAAAPFAHYITSPDCLVENYGKRHLKYPGYKQSAYLHPDLFKADAGILSVLKVNPGEPFFLLRFVSMNAAHDKGESGLTYASRCSLIERLQQSGRVFISSEGQLPEEWQHLRLPSPCHKIHDVMAFASLVVGDSQTMAAEAALLGTPSIRVSSFQGRLDYLSELESRYGLSFAFQPGDEDKLFAKLDYLIEDSTALENFSRGHAKIIGDKQNVCEWYVQRLEDGDFSIDT